MAQELAGGRNFKITWEPPTAICRVWQRPDLTSADGAQCAEEMSSFLVKLASRAGVHGVVFDVSEAPPVTGPKTEAALGAMYSVFEKAKRRIAVVTADHATQRMQQTRVLREHAPEYGRVVASLDEGRAFVEAPTSSQRGR
jgi:hypothetical protein